MTLKRSNGLIKYLVNTVFVSSYLRPIYEFQIKLLNTLQARFVWVEELDWHTVNKEWKRFQRLLPLIIISFCLYYSPLTYFLPLLLPASSDQTAKQINQHPTGLGWIQRHLLTFYTADWLNPSWHSEDCSCLHLKQLSPLRAPPWKNI